jgi:Flp pilus assembly protein TadG
MAKAKLRNREFMIAPRGSEDGQAMLEFALLSPLLVLILLGALELARVAFAAIEVSNAAKAAVQYGGQNHTTAADQAGMLAAAQQDAYDLTGLTLTLGPKSCVCSDGSASTCLPTDCASSYIEQTLTVTTQAIFDPLIHLPGLPQTFTLNGYATQKVIQN